MRINTFLGLMLFLSFLMQSCKTKVEMSATPILDLKFEQDYTPDYYEVIENYKKLDAFSENAQLFDAGMTDAGKPLHLFVITNDGDFDAKSNHEKGKAIVFINNGIHPGEPCGIDASMLFADELLRNVNGMQDLLEKVTICIIPVYNVGGHLNRSAYNRANQVGPIETGFRGNARNLDLNRDFLKCDSKNAEAFNKIFSHWEPDVFLDTHTTNGSDHQYSVTLIPTNPATLPQPMAEFLRTKMLPDLFGGMAQTPYELTPYVVWSNSDPASGITMTLESPRFSTGYSRLHHSYGFMTENHVYKTYSDRVMSAFYFIKTLVGFSADNAAEIIQTRADGIHESIENYEYALDFEADTSRYDEFTFKGYESGMFGSPVTGLKRFGYDRNQPFEKTIPYYTYFNATEKIEKPDYYILPSAWTEAVERMKWNNVEMTQFDKDSTLLVEAYYLTKVSHADMPYNGHYFHNDVEVEKRKVEVRVYAGDYLISTRQEKVSYIIESLEPRAKDSFFRWNFFDSMLDQREYFSPWGFEANAAKYLDEHPDFKVKWESECKNNPELKGNHYKQMEYIYNNTEWYEKSYLRYPVFRLKNIE